MNKKWFWLGIITIFFLSLSLRFWGLHRFNTLVFDEVYYANFATNYLTDTPFFDGHPPLAKYIIAFGIWFSRYFPFPKNNLVNGLSGYLLSPLQYRWLNAFTGSFIPLLVAAIAYNLSYRYSFCLLVGFFTACDGIFLVESRYALINQYVVFFGLLAQLLFLLALANEGVKFNLLLLFAGIIFGASISCKWNGLSFLLGIYLPCFLLRAAKFLIAKYQSFCIFKKREKSYFQINNISLIEKIASINFIKLVFFLGVVPVIIYSLIWIPHLQLDTRYGFLEVHQKILQFHKGLGGNHSYIHPYCAPWYTWPLMIRPIAYYYQMASSIKDRLPVFGPPLPNGTGKVLYDVHAMGNPFLWWFGLAAILFVAFAFLWQLAFANFHKNNVAVTTSISVDMGISLFLLCNYAANLLPWAGVSRCVFIYHYMTSVVFAFLAIAWLVDRCLASYNLVLRASGVTIIFLIVAGFVFWMPIYLGLPLSPEGYKMRMWFDSWI